MCLAAFKVGRMWMVLYEKGNQQHRLKIGKKKKYIIE